MVERTTVVDGLMLNYQGLLNINEFYRIQDKWFREKGFDKYEKRNTEQVFKDKRQIEIELEPWKKINDYAKEVIKMNLLITNVKDVVVVKDNHKVKLQHAKLSVKFTSYLETDWESKWEANPVMFFIRTIFDQFVYKINTERFHVLVAADTQHLYTLLKSYLNLQRY